MGSKRERYKDLFYTKTYIKKLRLKQSFGLENTQRLKKSSY